MPEDPADVEQHVRGLGPPVGPAELHVPRGEPPDGGERHVDGASVGLAARELAPEGAGRHRLRARQLAVAQLDAQRALQIALDARKLARDVDLLAALPHGLVERAGLGEHAREERAREPRA